MQSDSEGQVVLTREVTGIQIPVGNPVQLAEGQEVTITQSLGGSFTIASQGGLFRIASKDADALGKKPEDAGGDTQDRAAPSGTLDDQIWEALKGCYDPEIPVNIVDLGLIYSMENKDGQVDVKMTLTAPGCGMGPAIAADAKSKIEALEPIQSANVEVVWEPQWNPSMISPEGKKKLGIE